MCTGSFEVFRGRGVAGEATDGCRMTRICKEGARKCMIYVIEILLEILELSNVFCEVYGRTIINTFARRCFNNMARVCFGKGIHNAGNFVISGVQFVI